MIYNAARLLGHDYCMRVRKAMDAHVCECEIGLVLLDRYLSSAFANRHMSFDDQHLLTQQVKLSWALCLMISIKLHNDYHRLPSFYAYQLNVPRDVFVSNEVHVFMYLIKCSKLHVDAEDIVTMRRRVGNHTLSMFGLPKPCRYVATQYHQPNPTTPHPTLHKHSKHTSDSPCSSRSPHMILAPLNWLKTFSIQFCEMSIWNLVKTE